MQVKKKRDFTVHRNAMKKNIICRVSSYVLITFRRAGIIAESVCYLRLVCSPPVRLPTCIISASPGQTALKFDNADIYVHLLRHSRFGLIGQKYGKLYLTTKVRIIAAGEIKSLLI